MSYPDLEAHVRGTSRYIDDMPDPAGLLHAAAVTSPVPHARIVSIDTARGARDPRGPGRASPPPTSRAPTRSAGSSRTRSSSPTSTVHFIGQPVAVVVAETAHQARAGARVCSLELEELPAIFDAREAAAAR